MKAVIVEIHNNTAVILSDEGCVVRVKNNNYQIGQEVEINMKKELKPKRIFAFASTACLLFLFSIGAYAYYTPYTYVSLDVNPSIEYSVNRFEKVLSANGVNDDGTEIIHEISLDNLKYKSITDAISLTVDEILETGYLDDDTSGIVITTSSENEEIADELAQNLEASAIETCENNDCDATVAVEAVGATRVAEARALGVTPGKLNLVERLVESSGSADNIDMDEWLHKSVKDIMAQTKTYRKQNKEQAQTAVEYTQNEEGTQSEDNNDDNLEQTPSLSENSVNKKMPHAKKQTVDSDNSKSNVIKKQSISSNSSDNDASEKKPKNSDNQSVNSGNDKSDTAKQQNENSGNTNENDASKKEKPSGNSSSNADNKSNSSSASKKKGS